MKTFLLSAAVFVAVAAEETKYATYMGYIGPGCKDANGATQLMAMDVCVANTKITTSTDGNLTVTAYADGDCTKTPTVEFSAPLNKCGQFGGVSSGKSGMYTATSQSLGQACSVLKHPPYGAVYTDSSCTGVIASVTAQTSVCFNDANGQSSQEQCTNETVSRCTYSKPNCKGNPQCTELAKANECSTRAGGPYIEYTCPGNGVPAFCTATHKTTQPSNKIDGPDMGGIVAAVIIIPIVIIVLAVVAFVFIRKSNKPSSTSSQSGNSNLIDGSEKSTYGST